MPPLGPRRLAAWTGGLSEVAGLEEAYDESTREGGKPTVEQSLALQSAVDIYNLRDGWQAPPDEWKPVDAAPVDGARTDDEAGSAAVDGAGVAE